MAKDVETMSVAEIQMRTRAINDEKRILESERRRIDHECKEHDALVKENKEKIKLNRVLPYLVSNVVEILDLPPEDEEGGTTNADAVRKNKSCVVKT